MSKCSEIGNAKKANPRNLEASDEAEKKDFARIDALLLNSLDNDKRKERRRIAKCYNIQSVSNIVLRTEEIIEVVLP